MNKTTVCVVITHEPEYYTDTITSVVGVGSLPDIILLSLSLCYNTRESNKNPMRSFCSYSQSSQLNASTQFPPRVGVGAIILIYE